MKDILTILKKEVRQIWRDPYTLGIAIVLPLVLLFLFAYALDLDVKNITLAVTDLDNTPQSRAYVQAVLNTGRFDLRYRPASPDEAGKLLDQGKAQVALILPAGFARSLVSGDTAEVQALVDGTFPTSARVIQGYLDTVGDVFTAGLLAEHFASLGLSNSPIRPVVTAVPRIYFNTELKSLNFIAPGMIPVILMAFPPLISALAIVREKEHGSIQQIFVSPLRPWAFIIGKLIPYGGIAYLELLLVLLVTRYWFGIPLSGSLWAYLLVSIPYVLSAVAIGLLVSTLTNSQLAAMLMAIVLTMMPSFLFSGFMIPIFTMPEIIQAYTYAFPVRFFVDITSQIYLRGARFAAWWQPLTILTLYTAAMIAIATLRFKKKVG